MHLLVVSATPFEIKPLWDFLSGGRQIENGFSSLTYNKHRIDFLITGPGINHTAYKLSALFTTIQYDLCIQAGICGAFDPAMQKGDVVIVGVEMFAQLGVEDDVNFLDAFEIGLMEKDMLPFTNGSLHNLTPVEYQTLSRLKTVRGITVETVHGNENSIRRTADKFRPDTESMEGAPFFYACLMNKMPFLQIRSVSNHVEKRNKENWNITLAVQNLNTVLIQLLQEIMS